MPQGARYRLRKPLAKFVVPNVIELRLFSCHAASDEIWNFFFSGSVFPNLRSVLIKSLVGNNMDNPGSDQSSRIEKQAFKKDTKLRFDGLRSMENTRFIRQDAIDVPTLSTPFDAITINRLLTRLEIVKSRQLHPIKQLKAVATLL